MENITPIFIGNETTHMVLDKEKLKNDLLDRVNGVLHIGGHWGEEQDFYDSIGVKHIRYFEADPDTYKILSEKMSGRDNVICHNIALGQKEETKTFFCENSNNGQSSSFLRPKLHIEKHPWVVFDHKKEIQISPLDSLLFDRKDYNLMNIDVQGFELEVLKGSIETLKHIEWIITEVNEVEMYDGCVLFDELNDFLKEQGFTCVNKNILQYGWGDAFFKKY